jgi:hypothetical protein
VACLAVCAYATAAAPAGTATLQVFVSGSGEIVSQPAGLKCHADGNSHECRHSFPAGTAVTLAARADAQAHFKSWHTYLCPQASATCRVTLSGDRTVFAAFSTAPCTGFNPMNCSATSVPSSTDVAVDVSTQGGGSVSLTSLDGPAQSCGAGCYEISYAGDFRITASPRPGWRLASWTQGCGGRERSCTLPAIGHAWVRANFRR